MKEQVFKNLDLKWKEIIYNKLQEWELHRILNKIPIN